MMMADDLPDELVVLHSVSQRRRGASLESTSQRCRTASGAPSACGSRGRRTGIAAQSPTIRQHHEAQQCSL